MSTIHKQELVPGTTVIGDRIGLNVLHTGLDGNCVPCVWFSFEARGGHAETLVQAIPTGVQFDRIGDHVGSFVTIDGLVFHCYAKTFQP